ncbi:hypothetical protein Hanom_Chr06g00511241 [Helianthus anomalus]
MQPQGAALYNLLIQLVLSVVSYGVKSNVRQKNIIVATTRGQSSLRCCADVDHINTTMKIMCLIQ